MLKRFILLILILVVCGKVMGEENEESFEKKYEELKTSISESLDNQKYMKDAPEGLKHNNYVIDDKGYFWYIYQAGSGNYQLMRYNGFETEIIEIINDMSVIHYEDTFFELQRAYKLAEGKLVFLTPHNIITYKNYDMSINPLLEKDKINKVFVQNGKIVVIAENSYYIVDDDEIFSMNSIIKVIDNSVVTWISYGYNDEINLETLQQFLLTKNKEIIISETNYCFILNRYFRKFSSSNFRNMGHLESIEQDYYINRISKSKVDSILVMKKEEFNELINPMVEPILFADKENNSYLYFKYTNKLYRINEGVITAEKISITSEKQIVSIFIDKNCSEWVVFYDENNLYVSEFESFIMGKQPVAHYKLTEQESSSGGSFCLYWNDEIYKFVIKGNLNDMLSKEGGNWDAYDYQEKYKRNYIRYLKKQQLGDSYKIVVFNPGIDESRFESMKYSKNMLFYKERDEDSNVKKIKCYDLDNNKTIIKKVQVSTNLKNITFIRNNNLLLLFSEKSQFMQFEPNWEKVDLPRKDNFDYINFIGDGRLIVRNFRNRDYCNVYDYTNEQFTLRDSIAGDFIPNLSKVDSILYLSEENEDIVQFNKYNLETGKTDSLLSFSQKTMKIFKKNSQNLLLVNEDSYQLLDLSNGNVDTLSMVNSGKLYPLINEEVPDNLEIIGSKLFIVDKKILYDLTKDDYEIKDNWLAATSTKSSSFIFYYEVFKDNIVYRVSKYDNDAIVKQDNDFIHLTKERIGYVFLLSSENYYYPIVNNTAYYFSNDNWVSYSKDVTFGSFISSDGSMIFFPYIDIKNTKKNIIVQNSDFSYTFIDYDSNLEFSYNQEHGDPDVKGRYLFDNKLFVHDSSNIYKLNKSLLNSTLDISWLEVNGERKDLSKPLTFASTENTIAFPVAILNYMYPEEYPMKYKLTGFDKEWKVGTYDGKITYENLQPGKYSFDVQAFPTEFSDMSWPTIEFRILPPWYKSWWAYTSYALFLALVIYLIFKQRVKQYKKRQEVLENKVNERTHELSERTLELTEQQQKMRESIEYASLIQRSILPQESELKLLFKDYFVIWKPRDIVGGDFYWLYDNPDQQQAYLAVIDCTGHGVPGALLSMTVNSLLNYTIKDRGITSPAQIIAYLHKEICSLMHQKAERSVQDGFEIALLKLDFTNNILTYSGAGLNIVLLEPNKELFIMKGDRYNVGGQKLYANINFTEESYNYQPNTKLFLYSDGIVDQPRPDTDRIKRLGYKGWIETLKSFSDLTLAQQEEELRNLVERMLEKQEQRDDITVIGVRI